MQTNELSDELLARYIAGTASQSEIEQVGAWLAASSDHQKSFEQYLKIWNSSEGLVKEREFDVERAWKNLSPNPSPDRRGELTSKQFLANRDEFSFVGNSPSPDRRGGWGERFLQAAAALVLVLGAGWLYFNYSQKPQIISQTIDTKQFTKEQTLPDGSKVFLNHNSSITYNNDFGKEFRNITLRGEAFFDVKRDENRPFVILANGVEVKVLGTSFNVNAEMPNVEISVKTGRVQVKTLHKTDVLTKNEAAIATADTVQRLNINPNVLAYRSQTFLFNKTQLSDVVSSLRKGYHADVKLANKTIAQCQITAHFEQESLQTTLAVIAETLNLKVRKEGQTIWLDGVGCNN